MSESATSNDQGARRLQPLDSLRGLAALSVVLHHSLICIPILYQAYFLADFFRRYRAPTTEVRAVLLATYTPLHVFWAGGEAVLLFFVLSGFVLVLPFLDGRQPSYVRFVLRRVCRIYVPYATALLGAWALSLVVPHHGLPNLSPWFQTIWSRPVDAHVATDQALMLGDPSANILDNPAWSLVHEMRVSIVFPLIASLAALGGWLVSLALLLLSALLPMPNFHWPLRTLPDTLVHTCLYAVFFLWGALLAKHRQPLGAWIRRRHPFTRLALWTLALLCFTFDTTHWMPKALHHGWVEIAWRHLEIWRLETNLSPEVVSLGAGMVILLSLNTPCVERFLLHPPLRWLGKVSYSLYLIHVPLIATLAYTVGRLLPADWFLLLVLPAALLGAGAFHRWVEVPAIALGYRLSGKVPAKAELPTAA